MSKCTYCSKVYHPKSSCMKNKIYMLTQILEKNNISLPDCSKKREGGSNLEGIERVHAFLAGTSSSPSFIIDSRSSRHMVLTKEAFSTLDMSKVPQIVLGDDSLTDSLGKGGLILTMVNSVMYCMFQVLPLTSCQCIRWLTQGLQRMSSSPLMILRSHRSLMVKSLQKVLLITLRRYTCFPIFYPTQTPLLFWFMLMRQAIFGMKNLAILTTSIFMIWVKINTWSYGYQISSFLRDSVKVVS